jgi:RNA polymerase sigma-70 factor (ECF subfamily)
MLGSAAEADDAVQETMVRAWRAFDRFEGRASLSSWLHRIATNVCYDHLDGRRRRALPVEMGPADTVAAVVGSGAPLPELPEAAWLTPVPDHRVLPEGDPAAMAEGRESIRLAFVAALQHLPPRQRAVLILREVLRWRASEVAELLETTEVSVNSALQRARATLGQLDLGSAEAFDELDADQQALLERYVDAFERYDMGAMTALLREDATISMPPYDMWFAGRDEVIGWIAGPGKECEGSRLVPAVANGQPAFGQYRVDPAGGHAPWALQVLDVEDGVVTGLCSFLDTAQLFPLFGLPDHLDD